MGSKSVISTSMHKAGSTIADSIIMDILAAKGMELDRISLQVSASPLSEAEIFKNYLPGCDSYCVRVKNVRQSDQLCSVS